MTKEAIKQMTIEQKRVEQRSLMRNYKSKTWKEKPLNKRLSMKILILIKEQCVIRSNKELASNIKTNRKLVPSIKLNKNLVNRCIKEVNTQISFKGLRDF